MNANSESLDWYAGLTNLDLGIAREELGHGISLSQTYVHVMAHAMLAFKPPKPSSPHEGPWVHAPGGFALTVDVQLHIPATYKRPKTANFAVATRIVGLLRIWVDPHIRLAFVSHVPFDQLPDESKRANVAALTMETEPIRITFNAASDHTHIELLEWVRQNWEAALDLAENNVPFALALDVLESVLFVKNPALALVSIWGALEALFTGTKSELRFRVSSLIATYLEPPGTGRAKLQKDAAKLYDSRSAAAHGSPKHAKGDIADSYDLLRQAVIKMISEKRVPDNKSLEAMLFGVQV
ncbi:Apea-like HEPN [Comamonadaceae bacterium]